MAKNTKTLIRRLKKQVRALHRKEKAASHQLQKTFRKIKALGKVYERKAAAHLRKMKAKVASAQAGAYLKSAREVEKHVKQKVHAKQKALGRVLSRFEKHFGAKLSKTLQQKAKRVGKGKKSATRRLK